MLNKKGDSDGQVLRKLLDFRLLQLYRLLKEVGAVYLVIAFLFGFGMLMALLDTVYKSQSPVFGLLGVGLATMIHIRRKDAPFLLKLDVSLPQLFAWEYFIGFLPFSLLFLFAGNFGALLLLNAGLVVLAFIRPSGAGNGHFANRLDFRFLPLKLYELRSYLRRYFFPLTFIYLVLLALSKFIAPALLYALLSAIAFTAVFDELENKELFEAFHFKKGILNAKITLYLGWYCMFALPHSVLFLAFHFEYWYLLPVALFLGSTLILFNIFYKYAGYTPYRKRVYNSTANSLFIVSIMIPFFYPVTLIYLVIYGIRARKNIKNYYAENQ